MPIRLVITPRGDRYVQSLPATDNLKRIFRESCPKWLTLSLDRETGNFWVKIWGESEEEVRQRLRELSRIEQTMTLLPMEKSRYLCASCENQAGCRFYVMGKLVCSSCRAKLLNI